MSDSKFLSRLSLPILGRRSFFKVGVGAYASIMAGCFSRSRSSSTILLKGERDWVSSVCTLCPSGCAIRAYSESGRIVAVAGDPDDPNTGGKMCPAGLSMLNLHANPDRLKGAFRKAPDGRMVPARAEEILASVAEKVHRGGLLHVYGRITLFTSQLSRASNVSCHLDPVEGISAYPPFLNTDGRPPIVDFDNARIAFLFNSNVLEHGYPFTGYVRRIANARLRGLRLVTLSPFLTNTATAGDWIPIRTHAATLPASLAIARQALKQPELHVTAPPAEIADLLRSLDDQNLENASGLSRENIQQLARRFFSEPGPAVSDFPDASVLLLNMMKGNLNRPGGLLHPGQRALKVDADSGEIAGILRDPRNIVLIHQSNPAFSMSSEVRPILQSSSRATVVCVDSYMSETAELSDFVLPLASSLETLTLMEPLPLEKPYVAAALPAIAPLGNCRSFDDWFNGIVAAINGHAPSLDPDRFAATMIPENSGTLAANRAIYPLPPEPRDLEARMPAIVSALRMQLESLDILSDTPARFDSDRFFLTSFEESVHGPLTAPSKWLDEITYSPKIYLHPQRAARLGIASGDSVRLTGGQGKFVDGIALLFEGIHPDAAAAPLHHGHTAYGRIARGEAFSDSDDPDMERIFWGKNRGVNPAEIYGPAVKIQKRQG